MITEKKFLGKDPIIGEGSKLNNTEFGIYNEIDIYNFIENAKFDDFSYTGQFCFIQNAEIGKFSNIAACVRIGPTDHPMNWPALHHFTYRPYLYEFDEKEDEEFFNRRKSRITKIGSDTWIGHGAIIKAGINIGDGACIGAGSVVTKDVPDYAIVVGNPGRILRYRFSEDVIDRLLKLKWWNFDIDIIKNNYRDFKMPIEEFLDKYEVKKSE